MVAYVVRVPSLRALIERGHHALGTLHPSTLSCALRRPSTVALARGLVDRLAALGRPRGGELVALDSMAMTLPSSRSHGCARINRRTVGGGVLWSYRVDAPRGAHPVQILKIISGSIQMVLLSISHCRLLLLLSTKHIGVEGEIR